MKKLVQNIQKRIGWYPVTTLGWLITLFYFGLLLYVVIQINVHLYATYVALFHGAMIISGIIVIVLLWARITGERPFQKK
tara:strand:- start:5332 stop:5571 length:240 start_codon:yes stop_codon:yes gene_type:complete